MEDLIESLKQIYYWLTIKVPIADNWTDTILVVLFLLVVGFLGTIGLINIISFIRKTFNGSL